MAPRPPIAVPAAALVFAGLLVLTVVWPDGPRLHWMIGMLFGALFGHATAASAWTAFGPGRLRWRLPLSLAWLVLLDAALGVNFTLHEGPDGLEFMIVIGLCLIGQWIVLQFPLAGLAVAYGLRLRHREDAETPLGSQARQFGVRQLLIVTAIVAVVLGIGRAAVASIDQPDAGMQVFTFAFLGGAAVIVTLPLLLAALLPRFAIPAVATVLVLIGLVTASEAPLLNKFVGAGNGPELIDLVWINVFTCGWVLAFVVCARLCGYGLAVPLSVRRAA